MKDVIARQSKKLTNLSEKKVVLDKMSVVQWKILKTIAGIVVLSTFLVTCYCTGDIFGSLSTTATVYVVPLGFLLFLFSDKTKDANGLMEYIRMRIQLRVYKKHGFDPSEIESLERDIAEKKEKAKKIEVELATLTSQWL